MKTFWVMGIYITSYTAFACDVCGCAGMTTGFGDLSLYHQHTIGVSWFSRHFYGVNGSRDHFNQTEWSGRYIMDPRWSVRIALPYVWGGRESMETDAYTLNGMGDASLRLKHVLFYTGEEARSQKWSITAGLTAPTGQFKDHSATLIPQNFQSGTGSWNYLVESRYQLSRGDWVGVLQAQYRVNTVNPEAYKFGNQSGAQFTLAHKTGFQRWALVPMVSLAWEHFERDVNDRGFYQYGTGGQSFNVLAGTQVKFRNWLWSLRGGTNIISGGGNYRPGPQFFISTQYLFTNA